MDVGPDVNPGPLVAATDDRSPETGCINYVESDLSADFGGFVFVREPTAAVGIDETGGHPETNGHPNI